MKHVQHHFDELTFFWIFGAIVVAVVFFTIFWGNV